MRYYRIEVLNDDDTPFLVYTNLVNGAADPGALNVELDVPLAPFSTPLQQGAWVRVWGVSLQTVSQSSDLNGKRVRVYGGMQRGLPLANPKQAGLLTSGVVNQAFGNWIGSNMTLEMVVLADAGSPDAPRNVTLNWKQGSTLADAIKATLGVAFPGKRITANLDPRLVLPADEPGYFASASQFAAWVKEVSQSIIGGTYPGAEIVFKEDEIIAYDGSSPATPTQLDFLDLVGQPTWVGPAQVQVSAVMRADLFVGDYLRMPPAQVTTTAQSLSQFRDKSAFQGVFQVDFVRHVGNLRTPDGAAWVTVLDCHPTSLAA